MRLIPFCLPLVLAPLIVAGQQAQTNSTQKSAKTSAEKHTTSTTSHKTTRHKTRHHSRKAATRKGSRPAESTKLPVDVISGSEVHHVLLDKQNSSGEPARVSRGQMKVDVINGSATDTQYFSDKNQETAQNKAVVVGVESSDTRFAGGNKSPVVTGITSSSTVDAKTASSGGQSVTKQVSPRPKRPAYQSDTH
jgi:hypothetical protein